MCKDMEYLDGFFFYDGTSLPTNPIFVEVGSTSGKNAIVLKTKYPTAKVIVYEASKNFPTLLKSIEKSGLDIIAHNKAVAGSISTLDFYEFTSGSSNSIYRRNKEIKDIYKVEAITLTEVMEENKLNTIDILFLNCEGAELDILGYFLNNKINIRQIAVSFHPQIYGTDTMDTIKKSFTNYEVIEGETRYNYYLIKEK
jgi:FkbM family methyltransferase